jgi:hypothetical protein
MFRRTCTRRVGQTPSGQKLGDADDLQGGL